MRRRLSYSILGRSERPPYDLHRRGYWPMHRPHLPSQSRNRPIWLQAHLESSPWVPAGQQFASVGRYIYGTGVRQLGSVIQIIGSKWRTMSHTCCTPCAVVGHVRPLLKSSPARERRSIGATYLLCRSELGKAAHNGRGRILTHRRQSS
jgi:hypothetical protein